MDVDKENCTEIRWERQILERIFANFLVSRKKGTFVINVQPKFEMEYKKMCLPYARQFPG
jgi:hypothetical protein